MTQGSFTLANVIERNASKRSRIETVIALFQVIFLFWLFLSVALKGEIRFPVLVRAHGKTAVDCASVKISFPHLSWSREDTTDVNGFCCFRIPDEIDGHDTKGDTVVIEVNHVDYGVVRIEEPVGQLKYTIEIKKKIPPESIPQSEISAPRHPRSISVMMKDERTRKLALGAGVRIRIEDAPLDSVFICGSREIVIPISGQWVDHDLHWEILGGFYEPCSDFCTISTLTDTKLEIILTRKEGYDKIPISAF